MRTVPPREASPRALRKLARDLRETGISVRFEASWNPVAQAAVSGHDGLFDLLRSDPIWSLA